MMKQTGITIAALLILSCAGFGQDGRWEVSVNGAGILSKQTTGNQVVLTPTQGYGVIGSAQLRIAPKFALQINAGHANDSQKYATTTLNYRVQATVTEFTGALFVRPMETEKWKPFLFGGAGILVFNPNATLVINNNPLGLGESPQNIGAARQTQVAFLYGGGVDRQLPVFPFLSLRLQYRGLVYTAPTFHVAALFTGGRGHMAEPSIGLVFTF